MSRKYAKILSVLTGIFFTCTATAVTYTDNFSGTQANLNWNALASACLTAGSGTGSIPACVTPNDPAGFGALRLTPATNSMTGAILSNFTFPSTQGLQVTFTTYTYGGDSGGTAKDGADGIAFFLTDGSQPVPSTTGAEGGSLGYSCSNTNGKYEGLANAYLGLGVDEYGNFLNNGDNTNTGIINTNAPGGVSTYGTNTWGNSGQYQPMRIGLRGAGNTTWAWLKSKNPTYYSGATPNISKVQTACSSGKYVASGNNKNNNLVSIPYNYAAIPGGYRVLPNSTPIASEAAQTRTAAWPITYKLTISSAGLLNFAYSYNNGAYQPVLVNRQISQSNGPVPSLFRFGFSSGTGGSNNVHEITCFSASPLQSNSSASANTVQSGQVKIGTQIYLASYTADNWWGSLMSAPLVTSGNTLSISSVANWDAKCVLTGGGCAAMGTDAQGNPTNTVAVQGPLARTLLTANGSSGQAFEWLSLNTTQQGVLNSSDGLGLLRLAWLRGDRTGEQLLNPTGTLRNRTAVLGDIIDSSPTFVGAPSGGNYPNAFTDAIVGNSATIPENNSGAQTYAAFASANANRMNVVYVGGNDGFLHGFRAGSYDAAGNYDATYNDGHEVIGFMPSGVLANTSIVNLTDPNYVHNYYVDATPGPSDLFYGNAWHTWLVGGVGTGGSEIYALDITDPGNFSESNASSLVIGDWNKSTLPHLAQTVGTPITARLHNGQWAIIFGNGLGGGQTSGNRAAGVYIGLVDSSNGAVTFTFLSTGVAGPTTSPNGIAYVTSADLDGDHIADYLYAGDVYGNVWRFDVTDKNPNNWGVSKLFIAKDSLGNPQPITTAATVAAVKTGSVNRVMVLFGTGQKTPLTSTTPDTYATGTQTFYGIWDWNMSGWNSLAGATAQYATLTGTQTISRSKLLQQSVVTTTTVGASGQVLGYRYLSTGNVVCWTGSTACTPASSNVQYGWYFDLPAAQEQIVYNPVIIDGAVVVSTAIPPVISAAQCNAGLQTGWTMAFDPATGGGLPEGFFPNAAGGYDPAGDGSTVGGIQLNAVGSPATVRYGGKTYLVTQTVSGSAALSQVNPPGAQDAARVSWREIRTGN